MIRFILSLALFGLTITSHAAEITSAPSTSVAAKHQIIQNDVLQGSTQDHYQKPGAPIDLDYSSTIVRSAGEVISVQLDFTGDLQANNKVVISVSTDQGLEIINNPSPVSFDMALDSTPPSIDLTLYSSEIGLAYMHAFVDYYYNNKMVSRRVFDIPVQTGKSSLHPALEKVGNVVRDTEGNVLIIQEAETTVR